MKQQTVDKKNTGCLKCNCWFDLLCGHGGANGQGPCTASILATVGPGEVKQSYIHAMPQLG